MNVKTRRILCLLAGGLALLACGVLTFSVLKNYGHSVSVTLGPYKKALFVLFGLIIAAAVGFSFRPLNFRTLSGTLCIGLGAAWFTAKMVLEFRSPDSSLIPLMNRWMAVPLILSGIGLALWVGDFLPDRILSTLPERWQLLLVLLMMFICLQPVLDGGFNWDDAFFSVEAQAMRISGESIWQRVWREIIEYAKIGRINPFATFHFPVFYFIPDPRAYKLLLVLLTLVDGFLFYRFLRLWGKDHGFAAGALLILPLCFQLRLYHDPLNSYYGLMQVMFCELMLSLIWFIRWLRGGGVKYLILSLIPFLMGLMSYEMFFPLTVLFLIPAFDQEKRLWKSLLRILPFGLTAALLFGLSMALRSNITAETAYSGTTFSLQPGEILRTLSYQTGAAFPLSYRSSGSDAAIFGQMIPWGTVFNSSLSAFLSSIQWQDLLACLILALSVFSVSRDQRDFSLIVLVFGLLLWLMPGLVISLSSKYQQELRPGLAYIPVYFSCFGAATILYELALLIGGIFPPHTRRLIFTGAGCVILLIGIQDNRRVSSMLNDTFLYSRRTGEAALRAGIIGEVYTSVVSEAPYSLWEHGWQMEPYQSEFYSVNSGRPLEGYSAASFIAKYAGNKNKYVNPAGTVLISYSGTAESGFAKCGRLRAVLLNPKAGTLDYAQVTDLFFFVSGIPSDHAVLIYETKDHETKRVPLTEAWVIRETDQGTLYKLQENRPIFFDSIGIMTN